MSGGRDRLRVTVAFTDGESREWEMAPSQFTIFLDSVTSREVGWALIEGSGVGGRGRTALAVNRAHVLYVRASGDWEDD